MIVLELVLELVGRFVVGILFEVIILGSWELMKKGWRFLKYKVLGFKKTEQSAHPIKVGKGTALRQDQAQRGTQ